MSVTAAALPVDVEGDGGQRLRRGEVLVLSLMKILLGYLIMMKFLLIAFWRLCGCVSIGN